MKFEQKEKAVLLAALCRYQDDLTGMSDDDRHEQATLVVTEVERIVEELQLRINADDTFENSTRKNAAQRVADHAKATGLVHLGGEMEFAANEGPRAAYNAACNVAEHCGYVVQWKYGASAFEVTGGDIPGSVMLDWFSPDAKELVKVECFIPQTAYLK